MIPSGRHPSRRKVLAGLAAATFAPSLPAWAQTRPAPPANPDVVIVGAGPSGLSAARELIAAKKSVLVLEAMDRIGGRGFTDNRTFGVPFDWGCAWIHSADRNPMFKFAEEQKFAVVRHKPDLERIYYGFEARRFTDAELKRTKEIEEHIVELTEKAAEQRDGAVSELLPIVTPEEHAAATYVGPMDMAVDLNALSIRDYAAQAELDPDYLVPQGFGSLVRRLAAGVPIRRETPVKHIRYDGPGVVAETDKGSVRARACVVTASTGALASGFIRFTPQLPDWKQNAIADVPMGLLMKIPMLTDGERFGVMPYEDILLEQPGLQDIYFLSFPFETNLLIGFVGGSFAWQLSAAGRDAAVDFGFQCLRRLFGERATDRVVKADVSRWASNPWTRGAYSAALPGKYAARAEIAKPLADRIFFAGEALAGPYAQTCGGAVLSGQAVAKDVLRVLS
jgi:monoamine oxidase